MSSTSSDSPIAAAGSLDPDTIVADKVADGEFIVEGDRASADHGGHGGHGDEHHGFAHVTPVWLLLAVFVALVALTVITWAVAMLETGEAELLIAMVVATIKAGIVATWFMHLKYDKPLNALLFIFSTVFLALFLVLTISDAQQYNHQIELGEKLTAPAEPSEGAGLQGRQ